MKLSASQGQSCDTQNFLALSLCGDRVSVTVTSVVHLSIYMFVYMFVCLYTYVTLYNVIFSCFSKEKYSWEALCLKIAVYNNCATNKSGHSPPYLRGDNTHYRGSRTFGSSKRGTFHHQGRLS